MRRSLWTTTNHPGGVILGHTASGAIRSGLGWGVAFGAYISATLIGFQKEFPTVAERSAFAHAFGSNVGLRALFGVPHHIYTSAGFTEWRCLAILGLIGPIWAFLTTTRLLRGEEDVGRWELLLCGQVTKGRAALMALGGLFLGVVVMWVGVAVLTVPAAAYVGAGIGSSLYFSLACVLAALLFVAVGVLASQLMTTRRAAAGLAAFILGGMFAIRMVADVTPGLQWLQWVTPLGWVQLMRPFTGGTPLALAPLLALTAACSVVGLGLAAGRDVGAGYLRTADSARPRTLLLGDSLGLGARIALPTLVAWVAGLSAWSLLFGLVSKSASAVLKGSSAIQQELNRLGAHGAYAFLGVVFILLSAAIALLAAGQISGTRDEEATGRLESLLVRPVGRLRWLSGRLMIATGAVGLCAVFAGVAAWAGATSQGAAPDLGRVVAAGVNAATPAVLVLGFGVLVFGARPRWTASAGYVLIAWSFLIEMVGSVLNVNRWVLDTSIFHHTAAAPAVTPDWATSIGMVAIAAAMAFVGAGMFTRRDLMSA